MAGLTADVLPQVQTFSQPWCGMRRHQPAHEQNNSFPAGPWLFVTHKLGSEKFQSLRTINDFQS